MHIRVLVLEFLKLEDSAIEALLEGVVEESPNWHFLVLVGVFNELEKLIEHLCIVATVKDLLVFFLLFLSSGLHIGVEINFLHEELIFFTQIFVLKEFHLSQLCVLSKHLGQGFSSAICPQLLWVSCLCHGDFLERIIVLKLIRNDFEALVSHDTHIKLNDVFVGVNSFNDAHKTSLFKANSSEHKLSKRVVGVVA